MLQQEQFVCKIYLSDFEFELDFDFTEIDVNFGKNSPFFLLLNYKVEFRFFSNRKWSLAS